MSHTNTTANYNLPQFTGTDKPSWLTDVNGAMTSIDTQMKANADANTTTAGDLTTLTGRVTTAEGNIASQGSTLQTVSNVASTASTTATNAQTAINDLSRYLTLTTFASSEVSTNNGNISYNTVMNATNADGSVGKIYGQFYVRPSASASTTITIKTNFRPSEQITINGVGLIQGRTDDRDVNPVSLVVNPNGNVNITLNSGWYNKDAIIILNACLLFLKDFGDTEQTA